MESFREVEAIVTEHAASPQAQSAVNNYNALNQQQKDDLSTFLFSLGRREFDPQQNFDADHICAISDIDELSAFRRTFIPKRKFLCNQDRDVDNTDFIIFLTVYHGPIADCQCDGTNDLRQILDGVTPDADLNASPDVCRVNLTLFSQLKDVLVRAVPIEVLDGQFVISFSLFGLQSGDHVEFFHSFEGEGNGPVFGDIFCLNLKNPVSLGQDTADTSGNIFFETTVSVPPGATQISFQAGMLNGGSEFSQIRSDHRSACRSLGFDHHRAHCSSNGNDRDQYRPL